MQQRLTQAVNLFRQPFAKPWSCFILQSGAPLNKLSIKAGSHRRRYWMFRWAAILLLGATLFDAQAQERLVRVGVYENAPKLHLDKGQRSEEHTSELQSLMRISYAVFCLNKKTINRT